jgi:hypothetical protein
VCPTLVTKNRDIQDLSSYITTDLEKSYGMKIAGGLGSGGTPGCRLHLPVYAKVQLEKFVGDGEKNIAPRILRQITPQDLLELRQKRRRENRMFVCQERPLIAFPTV